MDEKTRQLIATSPRAREILAALERRDAAIGVPGKNFRVPRNRGLTKGAGVQKNRLRYEPERAAELEGAPPDVSVRELEVALDICRGMTNAEIGRNLLIAEETVKSHVKHLFHKFKARNRAHLVHRVHQAGLWPDD